ncbi:MAG: zinc-binding dehydrogenase [Acidobacteria bacterium]|nr:zinc-binding dehydrogenase [Acidobacteriota bacterium]
MKQKRVIITHCGGPEGLQLIEDEIPEPKAGEVRVKILTTGVAFADVLMREGLYPGTPSIPFSPGYDIVGVIDKLGPGAPTLALGQMVAALTVFGGYAQFICLPESELVPVPAGLDPVEAVSVVLNYVTAYQMLHRVALIKRGERALIHGAAGGVGTALLQLGKLVELQMYGTASRPKHELVSSLGGIPIDYKNEDFVERIREATGDGMDVVFDPIGGKNWWRSYRILRQEGRLIGYGFSSALTGDRNRKLTMALGWALLFLLKLLPDRRTVMLYSIASVKQRHPEWFREDLTLLFDLLANRRINPIIAERMPLSEAARAHELLDKAAVSGKIVLICHP